MTSDIFPGIRFRIRADAGFLSDTEDMYSYSGCEYAVKQMKSLQDVEDMIQKAGRR